ncbi:MAG: FAD/NAD(P)-binding protein [Candidatus Woesearchaeota archaeon]
MTAAEKSMKNPYLPEKFRISRVIRETHDTSTFRVDFDRKNMPGQFFEASVIGVGECPISVCSHSKDHIDLCIRNVGNVTNAIHKLKAGDSIWLRGPYGKGYPMEEMYGRDICLVGGGTGAAPLRGVLEFIESHREAFGDVNIFLGFRFPHDMLFSRDYKRWDKKFSLNLTVDKAEKGWKGNVGVVTNLIDKAELSRDSAAAVCGPPVMIKFVMQSLRKQSIPDENVYISFERLMSCGLGKCGHCEVGGKYICRDGPVFRYDKARHMED